MGCLNADRSLLVKQVKEANDIVAVVGHYLNLRPAGPTFKGVCPFHTDSRPSLDVDPRRQRYRCWSCGAMGDVIDFVMKYDKVTFQEAYESLARKAGINIDQHRKAPDPGKARLLDAMRWAAGLYQAYLLDDPGAESARAYLGERKLLGETVRKFGLGFAPLAGDWLARQADKAPVPVEVLVEADLIRPRDNGYGYYDRYRERVMFPIRNLRGEVVGFGGRILPTSAYASSTAKYINSSDSLIFKKSELVYALDQARLASQAAGYLAVVEGYTDVLMAHQCGVTNVVATMGTALTADHVRQMRRFAPKVVLVYDNDAGGASGVARALEMFIREDVDLAIATLPNGSDPHDLLTQVGPEPFRAALVSAVDVLEYKLLQVFTSESGNGVEAGRKAVEAVLGTLALAPMNAAAATDLRTQLILSRVARRFGLREATLWARLDELRKARPVEKAVAPVHTIEADEVVLTRNGATSPADPLERQLIEALLAEPVLVTKAYAEVPIDEVKHPGLKRILTEMYGLMAIGEVPDLDALRMRLIDKPKLADFALRALEVGQKNLDCAAWLEQVLQAFRARRSAKTSGELKSQLKSATDPESAMELLRKLQEATAGAR